MINAKKLVKMAGKWQGLVALSRKRILSFPRNNEDLDAESTSNTLPVVEKGHFVIYATDHKCFVMPLSYLNSNILRELFKMSEEEFGISSDGPITLPCDAIFMEYVVTLIHQGATKDVEKALLKSINASRCSSSSSSSSHQGFASQPLLVYGY